MAVTELDSFVNKFKSLLASGHKAKLTLESKNGNVWANLQVGLRCPQPQPQQGVPGEGNHQGHGKSPSNARQRRKVRREAARSDAVTEEVAKVVENTAKADASVQEGAENVNLKNVEKEKEDLEGENELLKQKVKDFQKERESFYNTIAVENMLHDTFKERMKDKYLYSSNDSESDYESDEEIRESNREKSREKKRLKKAVKCNQCDFVGKTEAGLKTHKTKKHKEKS